MGQIKTDTKSNEITAIPVFLQLLALTDCIVTIDAIGCQTAVATQIRDQGGDYLLALKGNHKKAYTAIKAHFHQEIEHQLAWRNTENFFDAFDDTYGRGQAQTHLQHMLIVIAMNFARFVARVHSVPRSITRTSTFTALAPS